MDDEEIVRETTGDMLRHLGYQVETATGGAEAVAAYRRALEAGAAHDLVIMDLTIPGGVGGREAVRQVLELNPEARIVVSSGYSTDPIMANFREHGFCAAIMKPCRLVDLGRVVRESLA